MLSSHFHLLCPIDVREQAQAKTLRVRGVSKAIHCQWGLRRLKGLPYSIVQFIIRNGAPVRGINIRHGMSIYNKANVFFFNLFILIFLFPNKKNLRFFVFSFNFTIPRKKINKKACIWNRIKRTKYYLHFFFLFWNLLIFSKEKNRKVNNGNKVKSTIWNIIFYFFL